MTVTIMTCDREPSYIDSTVAGLKEQNISYCTVHQPSQTPAPYPDIQHNARLNYAMTILHSEGLVIEDDVEVCKDFMSRVTQAIEDMPEPGILALYSAYSFPRRDGKVEIVDYPVDTFFGTQAMYFPEEHRVRFAEWVLSRLHIEHEPYDFAVKSYCKEYGVPLYGLSYSLVQHMGVVTTGLGHHHRAVNYIDNV